MKAVSHSPPSSMVEKGQPLGETLWLAVNRELVAKFIRELHYEEAISHHLTLENSPEDNKKHFVLQGLKHQWFFSAEVSIWGMLLIDGSSLRCDDNYRVLACDWLLDMRDILDMGDVTLSGLLEEVQQTLYSDLQALRLRRGITAFDLVQMPEAKRQGFLSGHPKAIANRGRLGWGSDDLSQYAPEAGQPFKLHLLAVKREIVVSGWQSTLSEQDFWQQQLAPSSWQRLNACLPQGGWETFTVMAVHPWQLQRYLYSQYAQYFICGDMIDLGDIGGEWLPQTSLRTLSSTNASTPYDTKTAISILNTSCYRGIPERFIVHGPALSSWLKQLIHDDPLLSSRNLRVQQEVAGIFCPHPHQQHLESGAYRYQEMLGCVWRERAEHCILEGEHCLSLATLLEQIDAPDKTHRVATCLEAVIELSGLTAEAWLRAFFQHVAVPLYHLLCQYGVAVIPHGQNVTLILKEYRPVGCLIKDFHGDLRLIDQPFPELENLPKDVKSIITHLPAKYLVHDLYTGHFASVMRFMSPLLSQVSTVHNVSEQDFYCWLHQEIRDYQLDQINRAVEMSERFTLFDILAPTMEKICINRVRFQVGYTDTSERPVPILGKPINNPLAE